MTNTTMQLPLEIRTLILSHFDDVPTLFDAIEPSKVFAEALNLDRAGVLSKALQNHYPVSLIGEALLVVRVEALYPKDDSALECRQEVTCLLDSYRRDRRINQLPSTRADAARNDFVSFPLRCSEALDVDLLLAKAAVLAEELAEWFLMTGSIECKTHEGDLALRPNEHFR